MIFISKYHDSYQVDLNHERSQKNVFLLNDKILVTEGEHSLNMKCTVLVLKAQVSYGI